MRGIYSYNAIASTSKGSIMKQIASSLGYLPALVNVFTIGFFVIVLKKYELAPTNLAVLATCFVVGLMINSAAIFGCTLYLTHKVLRPLFQLLEWAKKAENLEPIKTPEDASNDIHSICDFINDTLARLREAQTQIIDAERKSTYADVARQVAHDIRSPLTALQVAVSRIDALPEEHKTLLQSATQRIKEISADLGMKGESTKSQEEPQLTTVAASTLVSNIVAEKRLEYGNSKNGVQMIDLSDFKSYGLFIQVDHALFNRVLSNLINNAVESIEACGEVHTNVQKVGHMARITISDNGKGIPQDKLNEIFEKGTSYGKPQGTGMGLHQARELISEWNGTVSVDSKAGVGTTVTVDLPLSSTPPYFLKDINLQNNVHCVILDDDESIHQVWKGRLCNFPSKDFELDVSCFSSPAVFSRWYVKEAVRADQEFLYFVDYDLGPGQMTGIDVIKKFDLYQKAILVTSNFENERVQKFCLEAKVKMLPKAAAGLVPLKAEGDLKRAILIDPSNETQQNWQKAASNSGVALTCFNDVHSFLTKADYFEKQTPIYVDPAKALGESVQESVEKLVAVGFIDLNLIEELRPDKPTQARQQLPWIVSTRDKTPPWNTASR